MKKALLTITILGWLLTGIIAHAQVSNPTVIIVSVSPNGSCSGNLPWQYNSTNGSAWYCSAVCGGTGTWTQFASSAATGFPFTLGTTSITASSTVTSVAGLTVDGVVLSTAAGATTFLDGSGSYTVPFNLTTTGTSGQATFSGGTLNIPQYASGSGTVTSFAAPSASWPTWLVPTVTNSTTTPSLAVAASAIPNSALAAQTANTVLGALTATTPSGLPVPSCSGATNALTWTSGTGFGCNTISGGTGSVGTAGQIQMVGATAGSFAASAFTDNGTTIASTEKITAPSLASGTPSAGALAALPTGAHGAAFDESATAGVPASGVDYLRSDSTAHCIEMSLNGGAEACLPTSGGGTVSSGTANQLAYYASTGTTVSGTNALPSGATATTQSPGDNSTKVATTAYVSTAIGTVISNATITVGTTAIAANTCVAQTAVTMTGLLTTSTITISPASDISAVTGWSPASTGQLYFTEWPTANTLNYYVCNGTSTSITPGASTTWNVSAK